MSIKPLEETIIGAWGITLVEMTPERVVATMPVHAATHQPFGLAIVKKDHKKG